MRGSLLPKVQIDGVMVATVVAVVGAVWLYRKRGEIGDAINPTSNKNVAYKGAGAVVDVFADDYHESDTFGTWLAGKFNPTVRDYKP